jgi:hypothetical protein
MAFAPKKKSAAREPTYGDERSINNINLAADELSTAMRRARDSARMRSVILALRSLQGEANSAVMAEDC